MWRKSLMAVAAAAAVVLAIPTDASARGGHGGGFRGGGGGFHGGFGGFRGGYGGYRGGGFRGAGLGALGVGIGLGLYGGGYGYGGGYPYGYGGYGYPRYTSYYDGGCYIVRQRVWTPYGWRRRPVQVCG